MTKWLIPTSLQSIILGHLFGGLLLMLRRARNPRYIGAVLVVDKRFRPRKKRKKHSTTIGHCVALDPGADFHVLEHELTHIRQYEDLGFLAALLAAVCVGCGVPWLGLGLWASSGSPWLLPNFVTAAIRNKRKGIDWYDAAYLGSEHERAAYAQHNGWWWR